MNHKTTYLITFFVLVFSVGFSFFLLKKPWTAPVVFPSNGSLEARFSYLSQHGNSSCSGAFTASVESLPDKDRIMGSCCSPMSLHRYSEQVEGLKKYNDIVEIPPDPYDVDAGLAKKLKAYYDLELTPDEQKAYDYAMENSHEKGPCCCKCWRWFVYGGLGKYLIRSHHLSGEQLTEVWNLSDGCGGDEKHNQHG